MNSHSSISRAPESSALVAQLQSLLGSDQVLSGEADLARYATDILGTVQLPMAIVLPCDEEQVLEIVRFCLTNAVAIYPRGGGASYTHSHVPTTERSIIIDTCKLDAIITIDETNMIVMVQPGVTWKALYEALRARGLRTPFWGPFSGLHATVGGSISQHAISWGSGQNDASNSALTGMRIVTGAGVVLDTGTTAGHFYRTQGPDLTGLFAGDSGAFGVKTAITLRLIKRPEHFRACAFLYEDFADMAHAMMEAAKLNIVSETLAIDPLLQQGQISEVGAGDAVQTAWDIFRNSPNPVAGVKSLLDAALRGKEALRKPCYLCSFMTEGVTAAEAQAKIDAVKAVVRKGGNETANTLALAMRAEPFRPFTPVLGPKGERWWPMHCVLPFGEVQPFHEALSRFLAGLAPEMDRHNLHIANMFLTVGSNGFVYEPTLYWQDSQHEGHVLHVPEDHRRKLPVYPENREARAFAKDTKAKILALMQSHGSTHYQLGKSYPFMSTRPEGAAELLQALKTQCDPQNLMNPGALEFPIS